MRSQSSPPSSSSLPLTAGVTTRGGPDPADAGDLREALLNDWLSSCDDDWLRKWLRGKCVKRLRQAMRSADGDAPVELDMERALELPPHDALRAAGLTAPRLKPDLDFSEWAGAQALQQSLNALAVEEVAVSKLAQGQLPRDCRLESVRVLDLSMTSGPIDWASLLDALAAWPSLEAVLLPSRERAIQCPAGWSYLDDQHCLRLDRGRAAVPPRPFRDTAREAAREAARQAAQAEAEFKPFFDDLKQLLRLSTAVAAPIIQAHKLRLQAVQKSLAEHPELNATVHALLSQQSGGCVDAGLRRLDDIEMLLHCGRLTSPADAGPAALHLALLRRADQSRAIAYRNDGENLERANALRVLVGQRLNAYLGSDLRVASAPVYARLAQLRDVAPGETPQPQDWPVKLRQAADQVFQGEVADGFTNLQLLLAEEEGAGALIAGVLARDAAYQADLTRLEKQYQLDYAAAQDADPDNPMAGIALYAAKEQALAQRRFALLAPWTDKLTAQVRESLPAPAGGRTQAD